MRLPGLLVVLLSFGFLSSGAFAQDYPAAVATYAEHQGGNVVYHYELRNNGPASIRRFMIGCDCRGTLSAIPELQLLPVAASPERKDDFALRFAAEPDAVRQPPGWRARIVRPHGESGHWIEWYAPGTGGAAAGQTLRGFSVVIAGADEAYLSGRYTVHPEGGRAAGSGMLVLADTTPPTLSLQTGTAPETTGMTAVVRVVATAKDDRDPEPKVVVESFSKVEDARPPTYEIRYSATDASGNRASASARIPVPKTTPAPDAPPAEPQRPPVDPAKFRLQRLAFLP